MRRLRSITLAAAIAVGAPTAAVLVAIPGAQAQTYQRDQRDQREMPRVTGFDVRAIDRIEPGADLEFTVWGTPGSVATLRIDGAQRATQLVETSPGVYQGTYTITRRDQIAPDARVTANLRRGNQVGSAVLDEPLLAGWRPAPVASGPQIQRLSVNHGRANDAGDQIHFTLLGTPGGRAVVRLPGSEARRIELTEVRPGEYTGTYTIQPQDRIDPNQPVTARLRVGNDVTTTSLDHALDAGRLSQQDRRGGVHACAGCGTVVAVNRIEVQGEGGYVGSIAGGVLGAAVGSQFGKGDGRTAAGVAGAVGGALLGREVERNGNRREHFEVVVRLNGGGEQRIPYDGPPPVKVGDAVRIVDGTLQPQVG